MNVDNKTAFKLAIIPIIILLIVALDSSIRFEDAEEDNHFLQIQNDRLQKENEELLLELEYNRTKVVTLENEIDELEQENEKLSNEIKNINGMRISLDENEMELFYYIVQAESGICPTYEKQMVASAIINRVNSQNFPNNFHDVIFQKLNGRYQFDPIFKKTLYKENYTIDTVIAVHRALIKDNSNEALYFLNPDISSKKNLNWFRNKLELVARGDKMDFYK